MVSRKSISALIGAALAAATIVFCLMYLSPGSVPTFGNDPNSDGTNTTPAVDRATDIKDTNPLPGEEDSVEQSIRSSGGPENGDVSDDAAPSAVNRYGQLPNMDTVDSASDLVERAYEFKDESPELFRAFAGSAIEICNWSNEEFERRLAEGYYPNSDRARRSNEYLLARSETFCSDMNVLSADEQLLDLTLGALDVSELESGWIQARQSDDPNAVFDFIDARLSQATTAAEFITEFSGLNNISRSIYWPLGQNHIGMALVSQHGLTKVRALAAEMLWCDYYGGCGMAGPITLTDCIAYMICEPGISRSSIWRYRYSVAELEAARRLADDLSETMPERLR